ncbi:1-acyl-sn-glycerol-3-phosphate acyltransferase epsilon isoform X3 [Sciurus carolinensis]|uniref:1-acyl-sn-glycerol-3-phosphate acyltransferase epsilon isoform X3 n=1 Tax=Sciurus carolinensis TaxID=30640 RepID=UPI001FB54EC8|nr:1-acyl-sn-glycerol-3-phosphate acyltransferase epsilon isoform X3 [Sciurus carolinensis]
MLPFSGFRWQFSLSNSTCVDWIVADVLAIRQNALGHVRYVLKDGLKWLPLYGFYFSQHGGIYVKRSAKFNEKDMRKKLQSYVNAGTPMYLVIFPEGTRYNPGQTELLSASQAFAAQQGLPVLKHVLTPRIKATYVAFDSMKNYLDAIYDVTVVYEWKDNKGQREESPSMTEFLCKECPAIHIHFDRIDKKDVPEEQEYMRRWLHERFEIKDKKKKQISWEMYSFQTKSQEDVAVTADPEWNDRWLADDGGGEEAVCEHVALWDPAGLPVGQHQSVSLWAEPAARLSSHCWPHSASAFPEFSNKCK